MECGIEKEYRNNSFGDYTVSFSTSENVDEMLFFMAQKKDLPEKQRVAVYEREKSLFIRMISKGNFVIIKRRPTNKREEYELNKKKTTIVAICGGYPNILPIPITSGGTPRKFIEIGTGLVNHINDLPNADNYYPKRSFLQILNSLAIMNFVWRAGQEVCGQKLDFDIFICDIQKNLQSNITRMTAPPLNWGEIKYPSEDLIKICAGTTADPINFLNRDKYFFELPPASLPQIADFLLKCWETNCIESDSAVNKNTVHIYFEINEDLMEFLKAICKHPELFKEKTWPGHMNLRTCIDQTILQIQSVRT